MLLAKIKTNGKEMANKIRQLREILRTDSNYTDTYMIAMSRRISERNLATGLEFEVSNLDWIKDFVYQIFQNEIVFVNCNPWVKIMPTNIFRSKTKS